MNAIRCERGDNNDATGREERAHSPIEREEVADHLTRRRKFADGPISGKGLAYTFSEGR